MSVITAKFGEIAANPKVAVPTTLRKQTYMITVADPVLEAVMEGLVASKPTDKLGAAVCRIVETAFSGMRSSLGDLSVDGESILQYCRQHVDPVLRVRRCGCAPRACLRNGQIPLCVNAVCSRSSQRCTRRSPKTLHISSSSTSSRRRPQRCRKAPNCRLSTPVPHQLVHLLPPLLRQPLLPLQHMKASWKSLLYLPRRWRLSQARQ